MFCFPGIGGPAAVSRLGSGGSGSADHLRHAAGPGRVHLLGSAGPQAAEQQGHGDGAVPHR